VAWSLDRVIQDFDKRVVDRLKDFAEEIEGHAKNHRQWNDDTGSAAQSVTGWVVDHDRYDKNWDGGAWGKARVIPESKWGHGPENYEPVTMDEDIGEEEDSFKVALSSFMRYGPDMKEHWFSGSHTMIDTIEEALHWGEAPFLRACADGIKDAFG